MEGFNGDEGGGSGGYVPRFGFPGILQFVPSQPPPLPPQPLLRHPLLQPQPHPSQLAPPQPVFAPATLSGYAVAQPFMGATLSLASYPAQSVLPAYVTYPTTPTTWSLGDKDTTFRVEEPPPTTVSMALGLPFPAPLPLPAPTPSSSLLIQEVVSEDTATSELNPDAVPFCPRRLVSGAAITPPADPDVRSVASFWGPASQGPLVESPSSEVASTSVSQPPPPSSTESLPRPLPLPQPLPSSPMSKGRGRRSASSEGSSSTSGRIPGLRRSAIAFGSDAAGELPERRKAPLISLISANHRARPKDPPKENVSILAANPRSQEEIMNRIKKSATALEKASSDGPSRQGSSIRAGLKGMEKVEETRGASVKGKVEEEIMEAKIEEEPIAEAESEKAMEEVEEEEEEENCYDDDDDDDEGSWGGGVDSPMPVTKEASEVEEKDSPHRSSFRYRPHCFSLEPGRVAENGGSGSAMGSSGQTSPSPLSRGSEETPTVTSVVYAKDYTVEEEPRSLSSTPQGLGGEGVGSGSGSVNGAAVEWAKPPGLEWWKALDEAAAMAELRRALVRFSTASEWTKDVAFSEHNESLAWAARLCQRPPWPRLHAALAFAANN